jgi:hypothetical protein
MLTRILAATLAGGVAFFVLGFLIYGLVLDPMFMRPNLTAEATKVMMEVPVWAPLVLSNFVSALLFTFIFDQWAGIRTFVGGLKGGAIIMFLNALSIDLGFGAFMKLYNGYTPFVFDIIGATIMGAIAGGVIGAVLGIMDKKPSPAAE